MDEHDHLLERSLTKFISLAGELGDCFERPLAELTDEQRARVEQDFAPWKWDGMSPDARRNRTEAWDFQNDPATAAQWQRAKTHVDDLYQARADKAYWESRSDASASDAAIKQDRLNPIIQRVVELEAQHKQLRGDDWPPKQIGDDVVEAASTTSPRDGEVCTKLKWTPEFTEEVRAYREQHGTKAAAQEFSMSTARIREKLPKAKPPPKGYSAFNPSSN